MNKKAIIVGASSGIGMEVARLLLAEGWQSIAGTKGLGPAPSYSATKAMQATYLQALEQQAHQRGLDIRFTDIRPGFVDTALLNGTFRYPMMLKPKDVAREIVDAIHRQQHVRIIDWKYRILTALWRRIPRALWRKIKL